MKRLIPYLDDIFLLCGLISIITASYLVSVILGTYILGVAFLIAALFIGANPMLQKIVVNHKRKR